MARNDFPALLRRLARRQGLGGSVPSTVECADRVQSQQASLFRSATETGEVRNHTRHSCRPLRAMCSFVRPRTSPPTLKLRRACFAPLRGSEAWCQGPGLNRRPKAYESSALPLSYPGGKRRKVQSRHRKSNQIFRPGQFSVRIVEWGHRTGGKTKTRHARACPWGPRPIFPEKCMAKSAASPVFRGRRFREKTREPAPRDTPASPVGVRPVLSGAANRKFAGRSDSSLR
jgi:hypothetical protein